MGQTTIEPNKVQLAEKDIEDWLWENPGALQILDHYPIEKWIGRQVKLPSGIADLIGIFENAIVVVEVKNVELTAEALTQVCRYAADIDALKTDWNIERFDVNGGEDELEYLSIFKAVVFRGGVTNKLLHEAEALGVELHSFRVKLDLDISGEWRFTKEKYQEFGEAREQLARDPMFSEVRGRALQVYLQQCERYRRSMESRERDNDDESEPSSEN